MWRRHDCMAILYFDMPAQRARVTGCAAGPHRGGCKLILVCVVLQRRPSAMPAEDTAASGAVPSGVSPTEAAAGFSSAGSLLAAMAADAATGTKRKQLDAVEAQPEPADTSRKRRKGLAATEHAGVPLTVNFSICQSTDGRRLD